MKTTFAFHSGTSSYYSYLLVYILYSLRTHIYVGRRRLSPALYHVQGAFLKFDRHHSGKTSSFNLRLILWEAGISVSNKVLECLVLRYILWTIFPFLFSQCVVKWELATPPTTRSKTSVSGELSGVCPIVKGIIAYDRQYLLLVHPIAAPALHKAQVCKNKEFQKKIYGLSLTG
jgi:hypothetical protein